MSTLDWNGIYTNLFQCQQITQPGRIGDEVKKYVCISGYDSWYPYLNICRGCLPSTGIHDVWEKMVAKLYSVCRDPAGNTIDGFSLCATEMNYEDCIPLKGSSEGKTWLSLRGLLDGRFDSNRTQLFNLAAVKANLTTSTTTEPVVSMTTATVATDLNTAVSTTTPAVKALISIEHPTSIP